MDRECYAPGPGYSRELACSSRIEAVQSIIEKLPVLDPAPIQRPKNVVETLPQKVEC